MGFCDAVASAGPYANNLHPGLHKHLITQFFTGQMLFLMPNKQCQSTEGKHKPNTEVNLSFCLKPDLGSGLSFSLKL